MAHFYHSLSSHPATRLESIPVDLESLDVEIAKSLAEDGPPPSWSRDTLTLSDEYAAELLDYTDYGLAQLEVRPPTWSADLARGSDRSEELETGDARGGIQLETGPELARTSSPASKLNALLDALEPTTESLLMPLFDSNFLHNTTYEQQVNAIALKLLPFLKLNTFQAFLHTPLTSLALDRCSLRIAYEFLPSINHALFPHLASLTLSGVPLKASPCALLPLISLRSSLKHLDISSTGVSYSHLAYISPLAESLRSLALSGNNDLDDDVLPHLGIFRRLKVLDIRKTSFTFESLRDSVLAGEDTMKELERIKVPAHVLVHISKLHAISIPPLAPFVRDPDAVATLNEHDCAANLALHGIQTAATEFDGKRLKLSLYCSLDLRQALVDHLRVWKEQSRLVRKMNADA